MRKIVLFLLDLVSFILTPLVAGIAALQSRLGAKRFPFTFKMWDAFGVSPIRHHYYQPVFNVNHLADEVWEQADPLLGINLNIEKQLSLLSSFIYQKELADIPIGKSSNASSIFYHNNRMFGPADAEILYNVVRHFKPTRVIEIGAGYSTSLMKIALDTNRNEGVAAKHTCIEPYENPWLPELGIDEIIRERVEDVNLGQFDELKQNDILFIDSSHVLRTGGDVFTEYLHIIPKLNPGVLVHIHDIFLPYEYPREWIVNKRLFWTEQYLLQAFLAFNSGFEVLLSVNYLAKHYQNELSGACPVFGRLKKGHGSFWIRRK